MPRLPAAARPVVVPGTISMLPTLSSPSTPASASSSVSPARRLGTGRPARSKWVTWRLVLKPSPPASSPSRRIAFICSTSSSVASRSYESGPITW